MGRPRALRAVAHATGGGKKNPAVLLDELLPLAVPSMNEIHQHAAVLEVCDPSQLLELAADSTLRRLRRAP